MSMEWTLCSECIYVDDCLEAARADGCYHGEREEDIDEEYIKEMAKKIIATPFYPDTAVGKAIGSLEPQTLTITNCEKFKVQLRELDIEFELESDKLENIDTLIINGYKYVKEK